MSSACSRERLVRLLPEAYDNYQQLLCATDHMVEYRKETISQLRRIANELDDRRRNVNIAKAVGGSVGAAGAAATVAGIALSPFTLGGSLLLIIPGSIALGTGTTTAVGANLVGKILDQRDLEKAQQAVNRDRKQCQWVRKLRKEFENYCKDIIDTINLADPSEGTDITSLKTWVKTIKNELKGALYVLSTGIVGAVFKKIGSIAFSNAPGETLLSLFGKFIANIGVDFTSVSAFGKFFVGTYGITNIVVAFAVAGIGLFDLATVITSLIDLHKGSLSNAACDLRGKAQELDTELDEWLSVLGKE